MPVRSTRVFLANNTSQVLHSLGATLSHGAWTNDKKPPMSINPGQVGYWESESDGIATGTEGRISFSIGDAPNPGTSAAHSTYLQLLQSIPGIKEESAASILAEVGADMQQFPTARTAQLVGWALSGQSRECGCEEELRHFAVQATNQG